MPNKQPKQQPDEDNSKFDGFKKGDRIKNQITGIEGIITGFSIGDRTASIELANGETTRWYLYCLEKVEETDSTNNQGSELPVLPTPEDIQNTVEALEKLPSSPELIEFLELLPISFLNAAWNYIKQTKGSQANELYQSIKAVLGTSENKWGLSEPIN
ncbi:MAG: hypothetical protein HC764_26030 [Pleurocapsa sp. CRU_1_2]|nr:hypothetical protein [Pleurocapsa sp. CRU_1_2]